MITIFFLLFKQIYYFLIIIDMKTSQSNQKAKIQSSPIKIMTKNANTSFNDEQDQNYNEYTRLELIRQIRSRDRCIIQLKMNLSNYQNAGNQRQIRYKEKLEQQIAQNQKAVKAFGQITQLIISIIRKFQGFQNVNRESVASLFGLARQSNEYTQKQQYESKINESQFSCLDEIIDQTVKLLEYLGKLTEQSVNINMNLKRQLGKAKSDLSVYSIDSRRPPEQQINMLKHQINLKIIENRNLQKVIIQQEQQRNKLISSIQNSISSEVNEKVNQMDRKQLIQLTYKMGFRIKQLEKDKRDSFAKNMIERQGDYKRFQQLLKQVKLIKAHNNLHKSAF